MPLAEAVVLPSGIETKLQHVPVQLTRLPTTVAHWRSTARSASDRAAVTPTFVITAPEVDVRLAVELVAVPSPAASSVVRVASVGATFAGQSIRAAGRPLSFVTMKLNVKPVPHGIGDCSMLRYLKLIASEMSIVCLPTGPLARMCTFATPRVQLAITAPTYLLS